MQLVLIIIFNTYIKILLWILIEKEKIKIYFCLALSFFFANKFKTRINVIKARKSVRKLVNEILK